MWPLLLPLLLLFNVAFEHVSADSDRGAVPPSAESRVIGAANNATRSSSVTGSRRAFKKDLMVVLPVMQGNTELSSSNLQMLYTKAPVTAIIGGGEGVKHSKLVEEPRTVSNLLVEKRIDSTATSFDGDFGKGREPSPSRFAPKSHKSPLDYGYPESFKFVQELNELPKNHKPTWAQTEAAERDVDASTTSLSAADATPATKGDPFQMFESVKPLEINKLVYLKGTSTSTATPPVSNDPFEELTTRAAPVPAKKKFQSQNTESSPPRRLVKRPVTKRPQQSSSKKPPKNKIAQSTKVVESDVDTFPATAFNSVGSSSDDRTATGATKGTANRDEEKDRPPAPASTIASIELDPELYAAARYTTLLAETTKVFLPTPYTLSSERGPPTIVKRLQTKWPATKFTVDDVTSTSSSLGPNFRWSNASSANDTSPNTASMGEINPSDLVSLTKILGERLNVPSSSASPPLPPAKLPSKDTFSPAADLLTGDMKNMLIALGIMESERTTLSPSSTTTTATTTVNADSFLKNLFVKPQQQQSATPTIDPNSYVNFKKIPIDFEKPKDREVALSDDMRDLLTSFGLLPSSSESKRTRVSRQRGSRWPQNVATVDAATLGNGASNTTANDTSSSIYSLPDDMRRTLDNLGLLEAAALMYERRSPSSRSGHVFQPTIQLEEFGGDEQKVKKINDAIETIRNLSKVEDVANLSAEEVQKKLETITSLLRDENVIANNVTNTTSLTSSSTSTMLEIFEISGAANATTTTATSTTPSALSTPERTTATSTVSESFLNEDAFSIDIDSDSTLENLTSTTVSVNSTTTASAIDEVATSASSPISSSTQLNSTDDNELKLTMNPPNPLSPEELQHLLEFNQNDVVHKRQQPNNDTSTTESTSFSTPSRNDPTDETTSPSTLSTTSGIQTNNAPLPDLAASFGGGDDDESNANIDESSTPKPNGLYFYLDWNTFLNVGEADKNPVRIRFAPRAGNPRNFLPITVP